MGTDFETLIIGTGFAGLLMAYRLKAAGRKDFAILEKADDVGGTWRENTYPGAECDVASALYSYSFAPNPTWEFQYAKQPQILQYLQDFATDQGLRPFIKFGRAVRSAVWNEEAKHWTVTTDDGETYTSRFVVSAIGQLHIPMEPEFPGRDTYKGPSFHTARWDHSVDYRGKRVGIVGSAASAIQVIPAIAPEVEHLTIYQRSPNWIISKNDRPYTKLEHWLAKRIPALSQLYRLRLWCLGEYVLWPTIKGNRFTRGLLKAQNRWMMKKAIKDPALREKLTPDFAMGAKRILLSDDILPTYARDNVDLVFDPIETFTESGILAGGVERGHDLVVLATGFETNPFLKMIDVRGEGGVSIREHWKDGAHAYYGINTAGFPNFFMLYGPNTNTGHTSIVYKLEGQADYILQLIEAAGKGALAVEPEVEARFNDEMQSRLADLAWAKIDKSWYKDGDRVTNNWPGGSREFRKRLKTPDLSHYRRVA